MRTLMREFDPIVRVFRLDPPGNDQGRFYQQELSIIVGHTTQFDNVKKKEKSIPPPRSQAREPGPNRQVWFLPRQLKEEPHNEPLIIYAVSKSRPAPQMAQLAH